MATNYPVISFNAGELSPLIDARSDIDKYKFGCRIEENFISRIYGPAVRRPGTKFIDEVNGVGRVASFIYSSTIAYVLLFENERLYFYFDGARVLDGNGDRLLVLSPYLAGDLQQLQFKQKNDVMWITHPSYPPYKLSRTSATAFDLSQITFDYGPFKRRNDRENDDGVTMAPSVTTGSGTLTASSATFVAGHVGALFSVCQPRVNTVVTGETSSAGIIGSPILVEGTFSFTTGGTWKGSVRLERSIDGSTWEHYRTWTNQTQYTGTEENANIQYRINVVTLTSGTIEATLTVNSSVQQGICRITGFVSTTSVTMTVIKDFASTNADVRWLEGSWSEFRGYPACVTFFVNRAAYAGSPHQPQTVWFSAVDDYEYFFQGTIDDASFWRTLDSDQRNAIRWISALDDLIVGTTASEWRIRSNSFDEPITPTRFSAKQQTSRGSKDIQALGVNDVILFIDFVGRKVREVILDNRDKYISPDLTALAEHITETGLVAMAHQKNPDSILWSIRDDGTLLSMCYEREQNVVAWARHLAGPSVVQDSDYLWSVTSPGHYPTLRPLQAALIPDKPDEPDDTALSGEIEITNSTQLQAMNGANHYSLQNDIDLTAVSWTPIVGFSGVLEGNGFTISNLTYSANADDVGIFSTMLNGAEVRNLNFNSCSVTGDDRIAILCGSVTTQAKVTIKHITFTDCTIADIGSTATYIGCAVGRVNNSGLDMFDCHVVNPTITGADQAGGLIGEVTHTNGSARETNIVDCTTTDGSVTITNWETGGIVGTANNAADGTLIIHSCKNTDTAMSGVQKVGGIVGDSFTAAVTSCSSSGTIAGTTGYCGGLVGEAWTSSVYTNCHATGAVTSGSGGFAGGFVGWDASATYLRCFATGAVTCADASGSVDVHWGGFAGFTGSSTHSRCWAEGDVTLDGLAGNTNNVGGYTGKVDNAVSSFTDCYAWGSIAVDGAFSGDFGGFAGYSVAAVGFTNVYAAQTNSKWGSGLTAQIATDGGNEGGLIGDVAAAVTISEAFYDTETSSLAVSDGGVAQTTDWLMTKSNFTDAGWDLTTIWELETSTASLERSAAGTCRSVTTIPSATEDEVWLIVGRTIQGVVRQYLEQMQPRDYGDDIADAWFVDSGLNYDGAATAVLTGLGHLEGEMVAVLGDGAIFPLVTVSGGSVSLPTTVEKAVVGIVFQSTVKPMRFDLFRGGTSKGSIKTFAEAVISFHESIVARYGADTDNLFKMDWGTGDDYTEAVVLETGDKLVNNIDGFSVEDPFVVSIAEPVPCVVRAIIPRIEQTGR